MNAQIVSSLKHVDDAFYPEAQRIEDTSELLSITVAKKYLNQLLSQANTYALASSQTLLNRIILQYNMFCDNFGQQSYKINTFPSLVSAQKLTSDRQFNGLWGILNLFSSYDKSTIEQAFDQLAFQFEELNQQFNSIGFPTIFEMLFVTRQLNSTILSAGNLKLSSIYIYLQQIFNNLFLDEPIFEDSINNFYAQLQLYMDNKYPDGFDRIYTQLRNSYLNLNEMEYKKELLYISEVLFLNKTAPFKIDKLLKTHFVLSECDQLLKKSETAFYTVINYIINVYVECCVLTGQNTIESALLFMHDTVYGILKQKDVQGERLEQVAKNSAAQEAVNEDMEQEALGRADCVERIDVKQSQQQAATNISSIQQVQDLTIQTPALQSKFTEEEIQQSRQKERTINITSAIQQLHYTGSNFVQYYKENTAKNTALKEEYTNLEEAINALVQTQLGEKYDIDSFGPQLNQMYQNIMQLQQQEAEKINPAELIEILAEGLPDQSNFDIIQQSVAQNVQNTDFINPRTYQPIESAMIIMQALQEKQHQYQYQESVVPFERYRPQLVQLENELKVRQLAYRLSDLDVQTIMAKCIVETRDFIQRHDNLFKKCNIPAKTTVRQCIAHARMIAAVERQPFGNYFEKLPSCSCGKLQNTVVKMIELLAEMLLQGYQFQVQDVSDVFREGQYQSQFGVQLQGKAVQEARYEKLIDQQYYDYFGVGVYYSILANEMEIYVGGDQENFASG